MTQIKFNDAVVIPNMDKVMKIEGVDRHTISYEACNKIIEIFHLTFETDVEEIRAVRNSVVRYLGDKISDMREKNDEMFDSMTDAEQKEAINREFELQMWMSAITGALDHKIYNLNPRSI